MKRLYIDRIDESASATISKLWSPDADFKLFGLERAWRLNKANSSCFPEGIYTLVEWESPNWGTVWAFVGGTVSPIRGDVPKLGARWGCLIHPANYFHQIEGCLAPGMRRGLKDGELCVWSSRDALKVLQEALGPAPHIAYVRRALGVSEED